MKKLLIIIAITFTTISCVNGLNGYKETDKTFEIGSTVNAYFRFIRPGKENGFPRNVIASYASEEEITLLLSLVGDNTGSIYDLIDNPYSDKSKAYKATQEKFGDFNPNTSLFRYYTHKDGNEWILESGPCYYYCFSEQITKIAITSNADWDSEHTAGKDLSELFVAEFASLSDYVQRGFTGSPETYIRKEVNLLTPSDLSLLMERDWNIFGGYDISFVTTTIPENIYNHTITITFTLDTGETISYSKNLAIHSN